MRIRAHILSCGFVLGVTLIPVSAHAAGSLDRPVDDRTLDAVRGGFAGAGGGLVLSFAVQRSVYVDGVLAAAANDASTLLVVQRGAANSLDPGVGSAIVLQNSQSGGNIRAVTTIDAVANSLQLFRNLSLQTSLRGALVDSLRR